MKLEDLLNKSDKEKLPEYSKNVFTSSGVSTRELDISYIPLTSERHNQILVDAMSNPEWLFNHPSYKGSNLEFEINKLCAETVKAYNMEESTKDTNYVESPIVSNLEIPDYLLNDPEIVGYPDKEMQDEIYSWVSQSIPWGEYSIKDLGAGRGDFYGHLLSERDNVIPNYIGFEQKQSLVMAGKSKYNNIKLVNTDFFTSENETHYTVCIGTLNEDHSFDKWKYFNKTLNYALNSTKVAIIFVLSSNMEGIVGFLDYPIPELVSRLPKELRFSIDYSKLEDIYKLTVHIGSYN